MTTDRVIRTLHAARIGLWEWVIESNIQTWSEDVWTILGLPPANIEPSFDNWISSAHPEDKGRLVSEVRAVVEAGAAIDFTWRFLNPDGSIRYLMLLGLPEPDNKDKKCKYSGILTEITRWFYVMKTLNPGSTLLKSILNASPEGYTTDDGELNLKPFGDTVELMRMVELEDENRNLKTAIAEIRNLNKHINDIREDERRRVAGDIHDDLGQRLTAINLGLHWLTNVCQAEDGATRSEILSLIKMNSEIIASVQRIAYRLRPEILDDFGLGAALGWLIADLGKFGGPTFTLEYDVEKSILLPDVSLALFRISQECISNILKHSKATQAILTVRMKGNGIQFCMSDNGIGIKSAIDHSRQSMGLVGMQERIYHLGGTFSISGGAGFGTRVEIVIPLSPALRSSNG